MERISTYHCLDESKVTKDTPRLALVVDLYKRMFYGEPAEELFAKYCTSDFWWSNPEFHIISPDTDGKLYGALGVDTMSRYFRGDAYAFKNIGTDTLWFVEEGDLMFRASTWFAWDPVGEYTGFKDGERVDQKVTMNLYDEITFRDGRISSFRTHSNLLTYHYDMAGHDLRKAVQPFIDAADFWENQKENLKKGLPAREDPGFPFGRMPQ